MQYAHSFNMKNGLWSKRRQTKTAKVKTATPKRRQTKMATNENDECQNGDRTTERYPKRHIMIQCTQTVAQKSCVAYLTKKNNISPGSACNCRDCACADRAQNMRQPASPREYTLSAPDFIEIGSLSAELYPNA